MEFAAWVFSVEAARRDSGSALPDAPVRPDRRRRRLLKKRPPIRRERG
jgi:hypothetical protein